MPKRMQNQESWDVVTPAEEAEIRELVVPNQYRVILPHELPVFLPASLRNKIINGIVMATDVSSGWVCVANWQRVEVNTREIDQEPFGIFLLSGNTNTPALSSGMYLHHGDWPGRTKAIPFEVASSFLATSVSSLWPLTDPPPHTFGPLQELKGTSHERALEVVIKKLTR